MELAWRESISPLASAWPISDQYIQDINNAWGRNCSNSV